MKKGKILIVDDDQFYQAFCSEVLSEEGYLVRATFTGEEALARLKEEDYDIMLTDLFMPGLDGQEVLDKAKQIKPSLDVVIMTGYASVESAVRCLKAGATDYLTKPLNPEELKITVKRAIELRHLFDENAELKGLLTLYESCQRISSCLELDKLYGLALDALQIGIKGDAGLSVFRRSPDSALELKAWRGMEEDEARQLFELLAVRELKQIPARVQTIEEPSCNREGELGRLLRLRAGIFLPFRVNGLLEGVMLLFKREGSGDFDRMDLSTARFLNEQIQRSLENALNFADAQRLVFIDDVTGLFNTRYLDLALQTEIKRAKRFKTHLSLLFVDLDFFKLVNDSHGHLVGTKVLKETGKILKSCLREIDITIRYGGDEFIAVLTETDRTGAFKVAERIREAMEAYTFRIREGLELHLTCCVGSATFPDDADHKTDLIHLADLAMYRGKETTRNVVYAASSL
jgi:two-component system, cell cycle response regulator